MGVWRPLSGLICEIFNSVDQETFIFFLGKDGEFQKPMAVATISVPKKYTRRWGEGAGW